MNEGRLLAYLDDRLGGHTGSGPEYQYHCPFCIDRVGDESTKRKLWVNVAKGKAFCYRCGFSAATVRYLLTAACGGELDAAAQAVLDESPLSVEAGRLEEALRSRSVSTVETPPKPVPLPPEFRHLSRCKSGPYRRGPDYLFRQRGVSPERARDFGVGYCAYGKYAQRVVFPVWQGGRQVYFTTRTVLSSDRVPKTLNPPNEDGHYRRTDCLLGFDRCVGAPLVAVVEGPLDCMAFDYAVALMGSTIARPQVDLLVRLAESGMTECVVALDADAAEKAAAIYAVLADALPCRVSVLSLDWGDPHDRRNELPRLLAARSQGVPLLARVARLSSGR